MEDFKLSDVINIDYLQSIQDAFSEATGLAAISVDLDGSITEPSNFTDFCMKYTRGCAEGSKRCNKCDLRGGEEAVRTGKENVYYCHAGLVDFAIPIIIKGKHVGSILGGQILTSVPDEEKFKRIAVDIGIDPDEYIRALRKIPIISENKVRNSAHLLELIVQKICENIDFSYSLGVGYEGIFSSTNEVKTTLNNFHETSNMLNKSQTDLINEIENINDLLKEINSIVKSVSSLADETQMISFNASIEAARAGEQGKSFTVIAGEIRRLSEQSKKTVSNIQNFTANIQNSIVKTTGHSKDCMNSINEEIEELNSINESIAQIQKTLETLKKIKDDMISK